jgi:hypothetical protein
MSKIIIFLLGIAILGLAAIADPGPRRIVKPTSTTPSTVAAR